MGWENFRFDRSCYVNSNLLDLFMRLDSAITSSSFLLSLEKLFFLIFVVVLEKILKLLTIFPKKNIFFVPNILF